jgi:hypothetical protein
MENTSDDKQVLFIKVRRIFIRPGWGMYFVTDPTDSALNQRNSESLNLLDILA